MHLPQGSADRCGSGMAACNGTSSLCTLLGADVTGRKTRASGVHWFPGAALTQGWVKPAPCFLCTDLKWNQKSLENSPSAIFGFQPALCNDTQRVERPWCEDHTEMFVSHLDIFYIAAFPHSAVPTGKRAASFSSTFA